MTRPTLTVTEAKEQLDKMIARKLDARRALVDDAVRAGVRQLSRVLSDLDEGRKPWWSELAPLTGGERAAVYRAMAAGAAGSVPNVD
jgi:hypothetical protein